MIAHVGPVPVEELLPLAVVSGSALGLAASARLRRIVERIRRRQAARAGAGLGRRP